MKRAKRMLLPSTALYREFVARLYSAEALDGYLPALRALEKLRRMANRQRTL